MSVTYFHSKKQYFSSDIESKELVLFTQLFNPLTVFKSEFLNPKDQKNLA